MPQIKPFRGIVYDQERVKLPDVVAPPYDVISPRQRETLYARSPYNVVRLILGREEDPYASAAHHWVSWKDKGILKKEPEPAVYILSQTFSTGGGTTTQRRGFIAACRLEELGKGSIFPHEQTHPGPKKDRLRLFEATDAIFSQILALYADPKHRLDQVLDVEAQRRPDMDVEFDKVRNRLWAVRDPSTTLALADFLNRQHALVADGHHRYETALVYSNALRFKNPGHTGTEPYNFVPMYFTNMNDPGLVILPTHRLLRQIPHFEEKNFLEALAGSFELREEESLEELELSLARQKGRAFGLLLPHKPRYTLLLFKGRATPGQADMPPLLAALDVTILHAVIMRRILQLSEDDEQRKVNINYEKDAAQAARAVSEGKAQAAFLLNPTRIEQLRAIAEAGYTMPQKSTYFYPKLLSGLVMYSFKEG
ncbi:MAG: hypothetical protein AUI33_16910 [Ignavibacteria bacterium 13_1_40CM_2_61_4]|nr:MAG: hypothetical protein AUI33_16910 [Ignavibacteria bacterium 13_1_40CM_2_61_4]